MHICIIYVYRNIDFSNHIKNIEIFCKIHMIAITYIAVNIMKSKFMIFIPILLL